MSAATKVGDRVRLCWDGDGKDAESPRPRLGVLDSQKYAVSEVSPDGNRIRLKCGRETWFTSWVRVPAKKGRK